MVDVAWVLPTTSRVAQEMELVLSVDGGQTFPLRVTAELEGESSHVAWSVPNLVSKEARLALRAGLEGHECILFLSPAFAISVGSLAPVDSLVAFEGELWTREALEGRQVPLLPPVGALREAQGRVSAGFPVDASLDDPDSHLWVMPVRELTSLQPSLVLRPVQSDGSPESTVRISLPKRE